jgi:peptidoglycan/xylan/chitin deacetylase (PgdA/CDA1 family)
MGTRGRWLAGSSGLAAVAVVTLVGVLAAPSSAGRIRDPADASGPLDIARAKLLQHRRSLIFSVHTRGSWSINALDRSPTPDDPTPRYLCLRIRRSSARAQRQLCFGKSHGGNKSALGYEKLEADGSVKDLPPVPARVDGPTDGSIQARFRPEAADLNPHHYRWRVVSQWSGPACPATTKRARARAVQPPCTDRAPNGNGAKFRLRPVQVVGCRDTGPHVVYHGSRSKKVVALTFDDGPWSYTSQIFHILEDKHAKGTFFEIGEQVPGSYADVMRKIVGAGDELADHSMHHETDPGRASMAETQHRIQHVTDFKPCLFRPPGGAYNSQVVNDAASLGMTTVIWDVDPTDWSTPGSDAIYSRVVSNTRPGSIILMHDGGGNRSQTVAALPRIINTLRQRGYRFATVSRLLGQPLIWKPVG